MAGVKGRSGRRSHIHNYTIDDVINGSLNIVRQFLADTSQPLKDRAEVASRFALKKIPDKVEKTVTLFQIDSAMMERLLQIMDDKKSYNLLEVKESDNTGVIEIGATQGETDQTTKDSQSHNSNDSNELR